MFDSIKSNMPKLVSLSMIFKYECDCGYTISGNESKYNLLKRLHYKKCKESVPIIEDFKYQEIIYDLSTGKKVKDEIR